MAHDLELKASMDAHERQKAIAAAWSTGRLRYKLDSLQRKVYDAIEGSPGASFYFNKSRRVGGSYLLTVRAVEQCIRKPNAQVRYAAPTAKALRKIVAPNLRKVLLDCPPSMRPKWSTLEQEYRFKNGSILALAGCDAQRYEDLRGTEADEIYMDEVGFIDELDYILDDVLLPQVQDTGGRVILVSTPPRSPRHPAVKMAQEHMASGHYFACTVWDNPRKTKEQHEAFFRRIARGQDLQEFYRGSRFRREYLGEFIVDEETAVVPEWTKEKQLESIWDPPAPLVFDAYAGIDLGWRDGCAYLLGYWDFPSARLVITDELLLFRTPLDKFQDQAMLIEKSRLPSMKPVVRVCDNEPLVIAEMNRRGWSVRATAKRDKELQVNLLRELIRDNKLVIHPGCKRLNAQLQGTTWNEQRTSFERDSEGHGDLLDALLYLNRAVSRNKDPSANQFQATDFELFSAYGIMEKGGTALERSLGQHSELLN